MLAKVFSCAIVGLDGVIVEVEVDIAPGLPKFFIVGLPDEAVPEARERARAAVRNSGGTFPMRRIVANLAPANIKKAGPAYDLPIAVGILISSGALSRRQAAKELAIGYATLKRLLDTHLQSLHQSGALLPPATAEYRCNDYAEVLH